MTYRLLAALLAATLFSVMSAGAETVRWGRSGDAATLDPHAAADGMTLQLARNIYEPLVVRDADGSVRGGLASSWLVNADDPNVWVFNLRRAVFQDGSAFDAGDVVFSFERARSDGSALSEAASDIVSVRALDPRSVEIRLAEPTAILPAAISDILIMDKEWAQTNGIAKARAPGTGDEPFSARHANGTGPYRLESRDPDVRTKLVLNERYSGSERPAADAIVYLPIVNPAMQATALIRGEIDVLQDVAATDFDRLQEADGSAVETGPANAVLYLGYRFGATEGDGEAPGDAKNPFDDPNVREAIDIAISRSQAVGFVDRGHAEPTAILAAPFVNGWSRGLAAEVTPDRSRAKELLAQAGYPDGFAVKLDAANADAAVANRISSMLASIGIWADVVTRQRAAHEAQLASGQSAFHLTDYSAPGYDSAPILEWLVAAHEGYENPALSERIGALSGMRPRSERNAAIAALWLDVQNERIVLPIAQRQIAHAMRDVISVPVDPNNQTRFEAIRFND
ncbi:MAG: ABC transporter substrate-binding protein [Rhizobiaceae bacterium]